ncbi:MAG: hypothetical protein AB7I35_16430 [Ramlibacter sp.]
MSFMRLLSLASLAATLCACGNIQTIKSFSTPYQEPAQGARARIRVLSDGMVRAVPNSACVDWRLEGAGVMASPTKGFANMNNRKLGMPQSAAQTLVAQSHFASTELYVPAGRPLVLDYLSQGNGSYQCFVRRTFVPAEGRDYEAVFWQEGSVCRFRVGTISEAATPEAVALAPAGLCRASDNL